jgi:hypothetical protein
MDFSRGLQPSALSPFLYRFSDLVYRLKIIRAFRFFVLEAVPLQLELVFSTNYNYFLVA